MARKNLRRTLLDVSAWVAMACGVVGLIASLILHQPAQLPSELPPETAAVATAAPSMVMPTTSPSASLTPTAPSTPSAAASRQLCDGTVGTPQHVTIADLGIDADVEVLKAVPMVDGTPGDPVDKTKIGWQRNYPGVMPGACKGTVLMDGHTYSDNSAVFKESYNGTLMSELNKLGMVVKVTTDKGDYYYRIDWQKTVTAKSYPDYAQANDIYDVKQQGEERIFFATCSDWYKGRHTTETMFAGHRIPPP